MIVEQIDRGLEPAGTVAGFSFWTAGRALDASDSAWIISFSDGNASGIATRQGFRVRCVASSESTQSTPEPYDVQPRVVRDPNTGLDWQRYVDPNDYAWLEAKSFCTYLDLDGGGWRLPSAKELVTITDPVRYDPAIDPSAFPLTPTTYFWTASRYTSDGGAWTVAFGGGNTSIQGTNFAYRVRCVRNQ